MRTLDSMKREKQLKISSETVYVYAPLAHRMGLYNIKTELEDLAMKYMEPDTYKYIAQKLNDTKRERTKYINDFIRPIKEKLEKAGFDFAEMLPTKITVYCHLQRKNKKLSTAFANACTSARLERTVC